MALQFYRSPKIFSQKANEIVFQAENFLQWHGRAGGDLETNLRWWAQGKDLWPDSGDGGRFVIFEVPAGFERYLIEKGSVGIDGISLTVVRPERRRFGVAVIPVTLDATSLGSAEVGTPVHLEADMIGKWVERMVGERG